MWCARDRKRKPYVTVSFSPEVTATKSSHMEDEAIPPYSQTASDACNPVFLNYSTRTLTPQGQNSQRPALIYYYYSTTSLRPSSSQETIQFPVLPPHPHYLGLSLAELHVMQRSSKASLHHANTQKADTAQGVAVGMKKGGNKGSVKCVHAWEASKRVGPSLFCFADGRVHSDSKPLASCPSTS